MTQVLVYNRDTQEKVWNGTSFPAQAYRTISEEDWLQIPLTEKGLLQSVQALPDPEPLQIAPRLPGQLDVTTDFSPAHYFATHQGGRVCFSGAATGDLPRTPGTPQPILIAVNPVSSRRAGWVWRAAIGASVNCRVRRYRVNTSELTFRQGATPIPAVNRGGGQNTPSVQIWAGSDVTLSSTGITTRADPLGAWQNYETYVHGSIALPPGRASVYSFEPVTPVAKADPAPWASAEYVWWELPWEG